ncbi:hypothetical protein [Tunturiibacter gelidoferens]|uniref:Uncharacterized protein n=1 Tax=Tunturiibacter lichenicola TaxID=2051959 RepID=A0A7Y9NM91_9BACT|nr:hypothetical protein [Edaphobacter lichenicola]NYF51368.1 hypothetical protein [Edaphobacter lichenicola]
MIVGINDTPSASLTANPNKKVRATTAIYVQHATVNLRLGEFVMPAILSLVQQPYKLSD